MKTRLIMITSSLVNGRRNSPAPWPSPLLLLPILCCLFTILLSCLLSSSFTPSIPLIEGAEWNRVPLPPPHLVGSGVVTIEVTTQSWFAQTLRQHELKEGRDNGNDGEDGGSSQSITSSNSTVSILLLMHGLDDSVLPRQTIYLLPWPLTATRSGQQRWLPAPLLGTQPMARAGFSLVTPKAPNVLTGYVFAFGGGTALPTTYYLTSLWSLNLETTEWTPLGPSRMVDATNSNAYGCIGKPNFWWGGLMNLPPSSIKTVDDCYYSSTVNQQTDEFGCPWPQGRAAASFNFMNDALYLIGGTVLSGENLGEIWSLKLDANLQAAIDQQATSIGGKYVYNTDQLKYLQNSSDPTINRRKLCPVKWELITRSDNTASLLNQPSSSPFPDNRAYPTTATSGNQLVLSGGQHSFNDPTPFSDVWILDFTQLKWFELTIKSSTYSFNTNFNPGERLAHSVFIMNLLDVASYTDDPTAHSLVNCTNSTTIPTILLIGGTGSLELPVDNIYLAVPTCNAFPSNSTTSTPFPSSALTSTWSWHRLTSSMLPTSFPVGSNMMMGQFGQQLVSAAGLTAFGYITSSSVYDFTARTAETLALPFASAQLVSTNPIPPPRSFHAAFNIDHANMYVYGGYNPVNPVDNEMWTYQVDRFEWTLIGSVPKAQNQSLLWPPFTQYAAVTADSRYIYQFGGGIDGELESTPTNNLSPMNCTNHFYVFDTVTARWTNITTQLTSATSWTNRVTAAATGGYLVHEYLYPRPRCGAQATVVGTGTDAELYLFGGIIGATASDDFDPILLADNALWSLNLTSFKWRLRQSSNNSINIETSDDAQPMSRRRHNLVTTSSTTFLTCFGDTWRQDTYGSGFSFYFLNTCWSYDITQPGQWTMLPSLPSSGRSFVGVTFYRHRYVVAYGGHGQLYSKSDDTWMLDLQTGIWSQIYQQESSITPGPRSWHTLVAVNHAYEILLYGGWADTAVHVLHMDDGFTVGGGITHTSTPHNWLAGIDFAPNQVEFQFPSSILKSSTSSSTTTEMFESVPCTALSFNSFVSALTYIQSTFSIKSATITILDTESQYSFTSTRFLSTVMINTNITVIGAESSSDDRPLLACDPDANFDCSLIINTGGTLSACVTEYPKLVTLRNFTLRGGSSSLNGGATSITNSQVNIINVNFEDSGAVFYGGGLEIKTSTVLLDGCKIRGNLVGRVGGGIYSINSKLTINNTEISNNSISTTELSRSTDYGQGGGLALISTHLDMMNSLVTNNRARLGGGLLAVSLGAPIPGSADSIGVIESEFDVDQNIFSSNVALESGGGIYLQIVTVDAVGADNIFPDIEFNSFINNSAGLNGGGVFICGSKLVANGSVFSGNTAGGGGGAIWWLPMTPDQMADDQPVFYPPLDLTSVGDPTACGLPANSTLVVDSNCNAASYGPLIASPSASLRIPTDGADAALALIPSNSIVSPPIKLNLIDLYGQVVTTDDSSYVSVDPLSWFAGTTSVRAINGRFSFNELVLKFPPNFSAPITFTSSANLPFLAQDIASGLLTFTLQSAPQLSSGLQLTNNSTFSQISSCSSLCSFLLPATVGSHATKLQLNFSSLFQHDYDQLNVYMDAGTGLGVERFATFVGSSLTKPIIASDSTRQTKSVQVKSVLLGGSLGYAVELAIPSAKVTITLQVGDDHIDYVAGSYTFSSTCPPNRQLYVETDTCLEVTESSSGIRTTIIVLAAFTMFCTLVTMYGVWYYNEVPIIRATSFSLSGLTLIFLLLLPIGSILFALVPSESSDAVCVARVWFATVPIAGVIAVLLTKSLRIVFIAQSSVLKPLLMTYKQATIMILTAIMIQIIFCIVFTGLPLSKSILHFHTLDGTDVLVRECSAEPGFFVWFGVDLAYLAVLCAGSGYLAFAARSIPSQFNESTHIANALFMIVLDAVILVPIGVLIQDHDALVIIQGGGTVFIALIWNGVLFVPKFWKIYYQLTLLKKRASDEKKAEAQAAITAAAMRIDTGTPRLNQPIQVQPNLLNNKVPHHLASPTNNNNNHGPGTGTTGTRNQTPVTPNKSLLHDHQDIQMSQLTAHPDIRFAGERDPNGGIVNFHIQVPAARIPQAVGSPAAVRQAPDYLNDINASHLDPLHLEGHGDHADGYYSTIPQVVARPIAPLPTSRFMIQPTPRPTTITPRQDPAGLTALIVQQERDIRAGAALGGIVSEESPDSSLLNSPPQHRMQHQHHSFAPDEQAHEIGASFQLDTLRR